MNGMRNKNMKKIILISDIHNNLSILQNFIEKNTEKEIVCLGDIIGYNEDFDSNKTVEEIKNNHIYSIAGNWDRMVNMKYAPKLNYKGDSDFEQTLLKEQIRFGGTVPNNKYYIQSTKNALETIITKLSKENKKYLNGLKNTYSIQGLYYFVHGGFHEIQVMNGLSESSDFDIKQFNYNAFIIGNESNSQLIPGKIILHGHTHKASILYEGIYYEITNNLENVEFEIDNKKGAVISLPSLGKKVNEPDFNGYVVLENLKEKTKISFLKI
jgi:predicted phosphodiesterase